MSIIKNVLDKLYKLNILNSLLIEHIHLLEKKSISKEIIADKNENICPTYIQSEYQQEEISTNQALINFPLNTQKENHLTIDLSANRKNQKNMNESDFSPSRSPRKSYRKSRELPRIELLLKNLVGTKFSNYILLYKYKLLKTNKQREEDTMIHGIILI